MGRTAARVFGEPERPASSRMILALATNVRYLVTIDCLAGRKFERASDRNWPPVSDSTQTHSPTVASRPEAACRECQLKASSTFPFFGVTLAIWGNERRSPLWRLNSRRWLFESQLAIHSLSAGARAY